MKSVVLLRRNIPPETQEKLTSAAENMLLDVSNE